MITKATVLNTITLLQEREVLFQLTLLVLEDETTLSARPHRVSFNTKSDATFESVLAALNADLAQQKFPPVSTADEHRMRKAVNFWKD